jgi:hypothetical protein
MEALSRIPLHLSSAQRVGYMNVPFVLARYAVQQRVCSQVQLYLYLKWISDGEIILCIELQKKCCKELEISERTYSRNLSWLKKKKWLYKIYGKKIGVIGFKPLCRASIPKLSQTGYLWENPDFGKCKAFLIAVCATKCLEITKAAKRASNKGGAQNSLPIFLEKYKEIINDEEVLDASIPFLAYDYFSVSLKIPRITAYDYMQIAIKAGFIEKTRNQVKTNMANEMIDLRHEYQTSNKRIFLNKGKNGVAMAVLPNSYTSILTSRKIKHLYSV